MEVGRGRRWSEPTLAPWPHERSRVGVVARELSSWPGGASCGEELPRLGASTPTRPSCSRWRAGRRGAPPSPSADLRRPVSAASRFSTGALQPSAVRRRPASSVDLVHGERLGDVPAGSAVRALHHPALLDEERQGRRSLEEDRSSGCRTWSTRRATAPHLLDRRGRGPPRAASEVSIHSLASASQPSRAHGARSSGTPSRRSATWRSTSSRSSPVDRVRAEPGRAWRWLEVAVERLELVHDVGDLQLVVALVCDVPQDPDPRPEKLAERATRALEVLPREPLDVHPRQRVPRSASNRRAWPAELLTSPWTRECQRPRSSRRRFQREQVVDRLAPTDDARLAVAHEDGGRPRRRVVVRAHRERVGAGGRNREEVSRARGRERRRRRSRRRPTRSGGPATLTVSRAGSSARAAESAV